MQVQSDPRLSPALLRTLSDVGLDRNREPRSLSTLPQRRSSVDLAVVTAEIEMGFESMYEAMPNDLVSDELEMEVAQETRTIRGGDGQDMLIHIYRPRLSDGPLPCVVYFHGGGMSILRALNKVHDRWCRDLAAAGLIVIMVDFRNAYGAASYNPFPAGLKDCASAVHFVYEHRDEINARNIILQGEDGGGNLALATALKANREGWIHKIDGVHVISPMISNAYSWPKAQKMQDLPSLVECNGYILSMSVLGHIARFYTPNRRDHQNPLAWPYHAKVEEMMGLPPHVVTVEELDPLRDEGIAYARQLASAGVSVIGKMDLGVVHKSSVVFRKALPHLHKNAISEIVAFARRT